MRNYKILRAKSIRDMSQGEALYNWICPNGTLIWQQHVRWIRTERGRGQEMGSDHCGVAQKEVMKVSPAVAGQGHAGGR